MQADCQSGLSIMAHANITKANENTTPSAELLTGVQRHETGQEKHRFGKAFKGGTPCLDPIGSSISYEWLSGSEKDFESIFLKKKDSAERMLLENAKKYVVDFDVFIHEPSYPCLQTSSKAILIHLGDGGRWVDFSPGSLGSMVDFHNLDWFSERIVGFNLTSDLLEALDPEILAPRIGKDFRIEYALPAGKELLPKNKNSVLNVAWLERIASFSRLDGFRGLEAGEKRQVFTLERGTVVVENGMCIGTGFGGVGAPNATFFMAKLVDSCSY